MSAAALINKLHELGVRIRLVDGDLKIKAPKGALSKELQLELKASKAELIEFLGTARSGQYQSAPPLAKAPAGTMLVPSFSQQRLWFLDQLEPDNTVYNIPFVLRLHGQLNTQALEAAFNDLIARHEALRTRFSIDSSDSPIIVVEPELTLPVNTIDMVGADDAVLRSKLEELNRNAFDLARGPLIRMHLLRVSPTDHVLFILMHHIISDAWSLDVMGRELVSFYSARCKNQTAELPELPLQFSDYAWWEQNWLKDDELQRHLDFWRNNLAGAPEVLELPTDKLRPAIPSNRGGRVQRHFSAAISKKLNELAKAEGGTLFMVLLAAADLLLSRYTGQEDIVVGTPIAGRDRTELEGLIGFFINNLVMRTDLSGNPDFRELVNRAKTTALDAYSHQALPFDKLVEEIQPERNMSHTPIYQVLFMLQNSPNEGDSSFADLQTESLGFDYGTAKFDLTIATIETNDGIAAEFEYNSDLFEHATIERMMDHFERLLEGIANNPDQAIGSYDILSEAEKHQLLVEWNATDFDYPADGTMHGLFEQQVALHPDAIAVYHNGEKLSYAELNRRANRLAHKLIELGISSETLVAVCCERSLEMLTGMMAILKAGGAYVPIDPDYPPDRVSYMLADSAAPVVLTNKQAQSCLTETKAQILCLDDFDFTDNTLSDSNPDISVAAAQLGYTIYTSGSTGLPKGVEIEHRNAVALIEWMRPTFTAEEFSGVAASTSICFDLSVFEIFGTLGLGGRIVLVTDALAIPDLAEDAAVTLINTVPSAIAELVSMKAIPASVKTVNLAGEPLSTALVNDIYATGTVERVNDLYGPSEDTTYSTWTRRLANVRATIGRPIYNTRAYVLDRYKQPVPVGVPGELFLGGAGVTRGYRNQAELTAEKYISNPFSSSPDARMYGTGDLVRYQADGNLEYIGRIDHQIKLRGFRIELGEIEARLVEHAAVEKAVVIIREDQPGDKRLVGYIVANKPTEAAELKVHLQQTLPTYMVPAAFVSLDALPLTPNGKLNRKALPAPEWNAENDYTAPRNELEQQLADIWAEILGIEKVGIHDDFFEIGGHSLLATRLVSRIRKMLGTELQVRFIFEHSTIADLVSVIDKGTQATTATTIPLANRDIPLPLSYAQQRLWFLDRMAPGGSSYNLPWALRLSGTLNIDALQRSLDLMVRRHESLRTVFADTDNGAIQIVLENGSVQIEQLNMPGADDLALSRKAAELGDLPFNLESDKLLRVYIIRVSDTDHLLLFVIHHIIADAWSINVINQELQQFYASYRVDEEPEVKSLPLQYADFAAWHNQWVSKQDLAAQVEYWKNKLAGAPDQLEVPADHPRPPVQTFAGATVYWQLEGPAVAALHNIAKQASGTIFMVLLAAYNVFLQRYSGETDIVVGAPIAGRRQADLEQLIGFFVNTLPLRNQLHGDPTFNELLEQVKQTALDAYDHQDIPFEKLVEELNPQRNRSHSPIFQNAFSFQNAPADALTFEEIEVSGFGLGYEMAKFDLTLTMWDYDSGIGGAFEYNTDLFDRSTIERMCGHMQSLLEGIAEGPQQRISQLPFLDSAEYAQVVRNWNDTSSDYPQNSSIAEQFERQVQLAPDAIALRCRDTSLSYTELNQRANQLAHHLIEAGVQTETMVALCLDRSIDAVVAILAILKAGGAYVPLDPAYPVDRLEFMLRDTAAPLLISSSSMPFTASLASCKRLNLDEIRSTLDAQSTRNPDIISQGENLAYVIYTSGSTGKPKGVLIEQHSVLRLVLNTNYHRFDSEQRIAMLAPISFDASTYEMWGPLLNGGQCIIFPERVPTVDALGHFFKTSGINSAFITTALFNTIVDTDPDMLTHLEQFLVGGEALSIDHMRRGQKAMPNGELSNIYGPTESTTYATAQLLPNPLPANIKSIPIGRPLANTTTFILDKQLQPVGIGIAGELYIGGDGLARGYLNQPDLTKKAFIDNPFADTPKSRLYKTGDLVRWTSDGAIEFIGRIDNQVKMRGFRIELGEIEATLRQQSAIKNAAVLMETLSPTDKRLVSYLVLNKPIDRLSETLRQLLRETLPDYMVPSYYIPVDEIPLTANGKIDRRALPDFKSGIETAEERVTPRNELEEILLAIWQKLLQVSDISVHDDFFDIGGHSLLTIRLIKEIAKQTGEKVEVSEVFEVPTIAGLAALINDDEAKRSQRTQALVAIQTAGDNLPVFMVHMSDLDITRSLGNIRRLYGLDESYFSHLMPTRPLDELVDMYVRDMQTVQPEGPYELAGYREGCGLTFEIACKLRQQGHEISRITLLAPPLLGTVNGRSALTSAYAYSVNRLTRWICRLYRNLGRTPPSKVRPAWDLLEADRLVRECSPEALQASLTDGNADIVLLVDEDQAKEQQKCWTELSARPAIVHAFSLNCEQRADIKDQETVKITNVLKDIWRVK